MFSCEFCKIFKNTFFTERLRMWLLLGIKIDIYEFCYCNWFIMCWQTKEPLTSISHFAIVLKSYLKCMLTWFECEINEELLNKICYYNVSYREAPTMFPQTGEIPQLLSLKGIDQLLKKKELKRLQRRCFPVNITKFLRTPCF